MDIEDGIYYIYSDNAKGFWNNDSGWGSLESALELVDDDLGKINLPIDGRIVTASEAASLCDDPDE